MGIVGVLRQMHVCSRVRLTWNLGRGTLPFVDILSSFSEREEDFRKSVRVSDASGWCSG